MAAYTFDPVNHTAGTVLAKALGPVPPGEEWSVDVRICAIGGVDSSLDLQLRKTDGSNATYRAKSHTVLNLTGTFDLEKGLFLPAGYELWDRSGNNDVAVSYTGTKRPTA